MVLFDWRLKLLDYCSKDLSFLLAPHRFSAFALLDELPTFLALGARTTRHQLSYFIPGLVREGLDFRKGALGENDEDGPLEKHGFVFIPLNSVLTFSIREFLLQRRIYFTRLLLRQGKVVINQVTSAAGRRKVSLFFGDYRHNTIRFYSRSVLCLHLLRRIVRIIRAGPRRRTRV